MKLQRLLALAALALLVAHPTRAVDPRKPLSVAVAANLRNAAEDLKKAFESARPNVEVQLTSGASGTFFAQIQNGAPFDVFMSADRDFPRKVLDAGLAGAGGEVVYAIGKLVVWTPNGSTLDLQKDGLAALAASSVGKVAIANPAVAPYGRAAEAALRATGVYDKVKDKLVLGENVSQTAQFAQSGAADAALIPLSLTFSPELQDGHVYLVPPSTYPAQEQSAVVLKFAIDPALAQAFLEFVTGRTGREILTRYGYALP